MLTWIVDIGSKKEARVQAKVKCSAEMTTIKNVDVDDL